MSGFETVSTSTAHAWQSRDVALRVPAQRRLETVLQHISECTDQCCCLHRRVRRVTLPATLLTAHRCLTLIVPVVACCEVLSYRARSAADAVREVSLEEGPCGPVPPTTFESIAQLNADLVRARQAMQPLLVTGVAWCMMWGSLVGVIWIGGDHPTALYATLSLRGRSVAACASGCSHASVSYGAAPAGCHTTCRDGSIP